MKGIVWESISVVLLAILGGGLVNTLIEIYKSQVKSRTIRKLLWIEIKNNYDIVCEKINDNYPWVVHYINTAYYNSNTFALTESNLKIEMIEKIALFYYQIEILKEKDKENLYLDHLRREGKFDGADKYQEDLGKIKAEVRKKIKEFGKEIIDSKFSK